MKKETKQRDHGLVEGVAWNFHGGIEENHENPVPE
jgi:hypothetical protein